MARQHMPAFITHRQSILHWHCPVKSWERRQDSLPKGFTV